MANILADAVDILIDQNGNLVYLQEDKLYEYYATDATVVGGSVTFNNTDLGEASIEKIMNAVDVDYEGSFVLHFYADNVLQCSLTFADKSSRGTVWRDYPLVNRKAFQKLKLYIASSTKDTKIYSLELDFNVLRRRRYN